MKTHWESINDKVEIPDGWRLVRFGCVKAGEHYKWGDKVLKAFQDYTDFECLIIEEVSDPYVFESWMPSGRFLTKVGDSWHIKKNSRQVASSVTEIPSWMVFTPPTDEQYAGKPMLITHPEPEPSQE